MSFIDILKTDAESYELQVLTGFKLILSRQVKFIYIEVSFDQGVKRQTQITDLPNYLQPYGFCVSSFYNPYRKGNYKLRLQHCDMLLVNTYLIDL